jgi:nucleoside-diphosphate-sugar epimerase
LKKMRSKATNFLVTGGAGFIGSNIVNRLLKEGHSVRVLDNFSTGKRKNIERFTRRRKGAGSFELIEGDIRDLETLKKAMKGVDYCLHQAALSSVERSVRDPFMTTEVNIRGTLNVLTAAKAAKVKRVIFSSSSSIYGGGKSKEPLSEENIANPLSVYAATKLVGEHYGRLFFKIHGLEVISLRYFNVFGPYQDPDSEYAAVIPRFIKAVLKNKPPVIYGDGTQSRDFTYVNNVVEANLLAVYADKTGGESFNIATSNSISVNKLWDLISAETHKNVKPRFVPPRKGDVKYSLSNISKAKERLGYKVKTDLETGLAETIEYYEKL